MLPHFQVTGSGPPILFITCPAVTHEFWGPLVRLLRSRFTCITFDLRGHGRTPYDPKGFTMAGLADDLEAILDGTGCRTAVLCGYSTGATIAIQALLRHPDRMLGAICIGACHKVDTLYLRGRTTVALWAARAGLARTCANAVIRTNAVDEAHAETMRKAAVIDCRALIHLYRGLLQQDLTYSLPHVRHPVMLVYGEHDLHMRERYGRRMLRLLPGARLAVVPEADHRVPARQPQVLAELIEGFTREVYTPLRHEQPTVPEPLLATLERAYPPSPPAPGSPVS